MALKLAGGIVSRIESWRFDADAELRRIKILEAARSDLAVLALADMIGICVHFGDPSAADIAKFQAGFAEVRSQFGLEPEDNTELIDTCYDIIYGEINGEA